MEQLQKKLNSVMSENQGYRQMNRDKEQRLGRDKVLCLYIPCNNCTLL